MRTIWALKSTSTDKIMFVPEPKMTTAFIENGGMLIGYLKAVTMGQTGMIEMPILSGNSQLVATALNNFDLSGYGGSSSSTGVLFNDYSTNFQPLTFDYTTAGDSVRYILIPGGVHARTSAPPPDYSNYEAVCKYYGIPE